MKQNELYHYRYGSGLYNFRDELYHYGVPGMKWGKRKVVSTPINNTRAERNAVKQELKLEKKRVRAEQKEINKYAKKMFKNGRPGSEADTYSKGKSTALYNTLLKTKGKEFTDKVMNLTVQKINKENEQRSAQERARMIAEREERIHGYINAFTSRTRSDND